MGDQLWGNENHTLPDKYWDEAEELSSHGESLEAAKMFKKSALAEEKSAEPRLGLLAMFHGKAGNNDNDVVQYHKAIEHYQQELKIHREPGNGLVVMQYWFGVQNVRAV